MSGIGRRSLLKTASVAAGGLAVGATLTSNAAAGPARAPVAGGGTLNVRWIGGGVVELATPDNKQLAYVDAWVWNNGGYTVLKVERPAEFASPDAFASYVASKSPEAVLVLLTHDHADHMGDYFDVLKGLSASGLNVKTTGQSDLMRAGLVDKFKDNGLDPSQIVLNAGAGQNFGGRAQHGAMQTWLVPAVHSTLLAYPSAGFVLEMGGVVESQVARATYALTQFSSEVAADVLETEERVNATEVAIDRDLSTIIARRQPTARDLRLLIAPLPQPPEHDASALGIRERLRRIEVAAFVDDALVLGFEAVFAKAA